MKKQILDYLKRVNKMKIIILAAIIIGALIASISFTTPIEVSGEKIVFIFAVLFYLELSDINENLSKIAKNKEQ